MKPWVFRVAFMGALAALGIWAWQMFSPSPEKLIRRRLVELAKTACVEPNEGQLARLAKAQKLASFCTPDVDVNLELPGRFPQTLNGRDELMRAAGFARATVNKLRVEFVDIGIKLGNDRDTAVTHFTVKADIAGESTPQVEELVATFKRLEGEWLIQHVENVKTLR